MMYAVKPNVNALSPDAEYKDFGALLEQISKYLYMYLHVQMYDDIFLQILIYLYI